MPLRFSRHVVARLAIVLTSVVACRQGPADDASEVATAEGQVLTTSALAVPFGESSRRLTPEEMRTAVDIWIDYQLLGQAVARGDTLADPSIVDAALWGAEAGVRAQKWYRRLSPVFSRDSLDARALYDSGRVLTGRQILFEIPRTGTREQGTRIRMRLDSVRSILTAGNFARVAAQISADSLSRKDGGQLPVWPTGRNVMLPAFEQGILATPVGTISGMILTEAGAHLVYRPAWREAEKRVRPVVRELSRIRAESLYFDRLLTARNVLIAPDVAPAVRAIVQAPERFADSASVLATITGGDFTAGALVRWLRAFPPSEGMDRQLLNAPDTLVPTLLRRIITNELFLRQADSAGIALTADERRVLSGQLRTTLVSTVNTLGIAETMLPDSVRRMPVAQRQAFLAARVNAQFASMLRGAAMYVPVAPAVRTLLRRRYPTVSVRADGLARALTAAQRVRQTTDSLRNNQSADSARPAAPMAPR